MATSINITPEQRQALEKIRARKEAEMGTKLHFKNILDLAIKLFIEENKKS